MSGNPFRRASHSPSTAAADSHGDMTPRFPPVDLVEPDDRNASPSPNRTKRVRITTPSQSPPQPSSPVQGLKQTRHALARRVSAGSHAGSPPPPDSDSSDSESDDAEDPFGKDAASDSELDPDVVARNTRKNSVNMSGGPGPAVASPRPNPFQRTLATMERHVSFRDESPRELREDDDQAQAAGSTHASMDVDAFKRLLMTGSVASPDQSLSARAPIPSSGLTGHDPVVPNTASQVDSSGTDASSTSYQSTTQPAQERRLQTPPTSNEVSLVDEDHTSPSSSSFDRDAEREEEKRKPPPPPKHRHGKTVSPASEQRHPQTVSFDDFAASFSTFGSASLRNQDSQPTPLAPLPQRTASDQRNRGPLPLTPSAVPEISTEPSSPSTIPPTSPFPTFESGAHPVSSNADASASTASDPLPEAKRRVPPALPLARRQSKRADTGGSGSGSAGPGPGRPSSTRSRSNSTLTTSSGAGAADPPASSASSSPAVLASGTQPGSAGKPPPPPPTRRSGPSFTSSSPIDQAPASATRTHRTSSASSSLRNTNIMPPPAPPPRRSSARANGGDAARSDVESRRASVEASATALASPPPGVEVTEPGLKEEGTLSVGAAAEPDILADMTEFQREIDALRERYGAAS